jgi:hypothetical protein
MPRRPSRSPSDLDVIFGPAKTVLTENVVTGHEIP